MSAKSLTVDDQLINNFASLVKELNPYTVQISKNITVEFKTNVNERIRQLMAEITDVYNQIKDKSLKVPGIVTNNNTQPSVETVYKNLKIVRNYLDQDDCKLPMVVDSKKLDDVKGMDIEKTKLSAKFIGINPVRAVLLYGPSGTGKIVLADAAVVSIDTDIRNDAKVTAPQAGFAFNFMPEGDLRMQKSSLLKLFDCAQNKAADTDMKAVSIVMVDNANTLSPALQDYLAQLLNPKTMEITYRQVRVIVSSQKPWTLAPALLRVIGRDNSIFVNLPNNDLRKMIIEGDINAWFTKSLSGTDGGKRNKLVDDLVDWTGASLRGKDLLIENGLTQDQATDFFKRYGQDPKAGDTLFGYTIPEIKDLLERVIRHAFARNVKESIANKTCTTERDLKMCKDNVAQLAAEIKNIDINLAAINDSLSPSTSGGGSGSAKATKDSASIQKELDEKMARLKKMEARCKPCPTPEQFKTNLTPSNVTNADISSALQEINGDRASNLDYIQYVRWETNVVSDKAPCVDCPGKPRRVFVKTYKL